MTRASWRSTRLATAACSRRSPSKTNRSVPTARPPSIYLEFLAPLMGRETKIIEVQTGVRAQALRYLDLLAFEPMNVNASLVPELGIQGEHMIRVPQPALYVAQKILARGSGRLSTPAKAAKDLAYTYDAAVLSRPVWPEQAALVERARRESTTWKKWIARAARDLRTLFANPASDGVLQAASVYRDAFGREAVDDRAIHLTVERFTKEVFGTT